jgi:hypothetical protein
MARHRQWAAGHRAGEAVRARNGLPSSIRHELIPVPTVM